MSRSSRSLWKGAVAGMVGGLVASWVKGQVEPPLQRLAESIAPPTHHAKEQPGADISGKPERMPPATLAQRLTDHTLSTDQKLAAQERIHYAFGGGAGLAYGVLAEVAPVTVGLGMPAATALWAGTHLTTLPAAGLSAKPNELPASAHLWEFGSHLVFGLTAELVRRAVRVGL